jgi:hypothetical protein
MKAIVVQLGLATMPLGMDASSSGLTSETTNGTSGSIRQADELSTTSAPASTTWGASTREAVAPLEKSASSRPAKSAVAESSTVTSPSPHGSVRPADRAEAKYLIWSTGNDRSASS